MDVCVVLLVILFVVPLLILVGILTGLLEPFESLETEDDFPKVSVRSVGIDKETIKGRNVYGFFVTKDEFEKLSPDIHSNRILGALNLEAKKIHLMYSDEKTKFSPEFLEKARRGEFIKKETEEEIQKKLTEHGIPIREINLISRIFGFPETI